MLQRKVLQRRAARGGGGRGASEPSAPAGGGSALPDGVRGKMEGSFGQDFSDVRVHAGSGHAPALGAQAYTQGTDIHFAPGHYDPSSSGGQELLGHELAHVVQQRSGRVAVPQGKDGVINADPSLEAEADAAGARAARGEPARVAGSSAGMRSAVGPVQRKGGNPELIRFAALQLWGACTVGGNDGVILNWITGPMAYYPPEDKVVFLAALDQKKRQDIRTYLGAMTSIVGAYKDDVAKIFPELAPIKPAPAPADASKKPTEPPAPPVTALDAHGPHVTSEVHAKPEAHDDSSKASHDTGTKDARKDTGVLTAVMGHVPPASDVKPVAKSEKQVKREQAVNIFKLASNTRGRRLAECFNLYDMRDVIYASMAMSGAPMTEIPDGSAQVVELRSFNGACSWLTTPVPISTDADFRRAFFDSIDPMRTIAPGRTYDELRTVIQRSTTPAQAAYLLEVAEHGRPSVVTQVKLAAGLVIPGLVFKPSADENEVVRLVEKVAPLEVTDWGKFFTDIGAVLKKVNKRTSKRLIAFKEVKLGEQANEKAAADFVDALHANHLASMVPKAPDPHGASHDSGADPHGGHSSPTVPPTTPAKSPADTGAHAKQDASHSPPLPKGPDHDGPDPVQVIWHEDPSPEALQANLVALDQRVDHARHALQRVIPLVVDKNEDPMTGVVREQRHALLKSAGSLRDDAAEKLKQLAAAQAPPKKVSSKSSAQQDAPADEPKDKPLRDHKAEEALVAAIQKDLTGIGGDAEKLEGLLKVLPAAQTLGKSTQSLRAAKIAYLVRVIRSNTNHDPIKHLGSRTLDEKGFEQVEEWVHENHGDPQVRQDALADGAFVAALGKLVEYDRKFLVAMVKGDPTGKKKDHVVVTDAMFARETDKLHGRPANSDHNKLEEHLLGMKPEERAEYLAAQPHGKLSFNEKVHGAMPDATISMPGGNRERAKQRERLKAFFSVPVGGGPTFVELHTFVLTTKKTGDAFAEKALRLISKLQGDEFLQVRQDVLTMRPPADYVDQSRPIVRPLLEELERRLGPSSAAWKQVQDIFGNTRRLDDPKLDPKDKASMARQDAELQPAHWTALLEIELARPAWTVTRPHITSDLEVGVRDKQDKEEIYLLCHRAQTASRRNSLAMGTASHGQVTGPNPADFMRAIYDGLSKKAKDTLTTNFGRLAAAFKDGSAITVDMLLGEVLGRAAQGKTGFFIDAAHLEQTFQQCSGKELLAEWSNIEAFKQAMKDAGPDEDKKRKLRQGFVIDVRADRRKQIEAGMSPAAALKTVNKLRAKLATALEQDDEFQKAMHDDGFEGDAMSGERIAATGLMEESYVRGTAWQMRTWSSKGMDHQQASRGYAYEALDADIAVQKAPDQAQKAELDKHKQKLDTAKKGAMDTGRAFDALRAQVKKLITYAIALMVMSAVVGITHGAAIAPILTVLVKIGGYVMIDVCKAAVNRMFDGENYDVRKNLTNSIADVIGGAALFGAMGIEDAIYVGADVKNEYVKNFIKSTFNQVLKASIGDGVKAGFERNVGDMSGSQAGFDVFRSYAAALIAEMGNAGAVVNIEKPEESHFEGTFGEKVDHKLESPHPDNYEDIGGQFERPADILIDEGKEKLTEKEQHKVNRGKAQSGKLLPGRGWDGARRFVLNIVRPGTGEGISVPQLRAEQTSQRAKGDSHWADAVLATCANEIYVGGVLGAKGGRAVDLSLGLVSLPAAAVPAIEGQLSAAVKDLDRDKSGKVIAPLGVKLVEASTAVPVAVTPPAKAKDEAPATSGGKKKDGDRGGGIEAPADLAKDGQPSSTAHDKGGPSSDKDASPPSKKEPADSSAKSSDQSKKSGEGADAHAPPQAVGGTPLVAVDGTITPTQALINLYLDKIRNTKAHLAEGEGNQLATHIGVRASVYNKRAGKEIYYTGFYGTGARLGAILHDGDHYRYLVPADPQAESFNFQEVLIHGEREQRVDRQSAGKFNVGYATVTDGNCLIDALYAVKNGGRGGATEEEFTAARLFIAGDPGGSAADTLRAAIGSMLAGLASGLGAGYAEVERQILLDPSFQRARKH